MSDAEAEKVLSLNEAENPADGVLADIWAGRERLSFRLGPNRLALEPGDVLDLGALGGGPALIERIEDGAQHARTVHARHVAPRGRRLRGAARPFSPETAPAFGPP